MTQNRQEVVKRRIPRADNINEHYYARNNEPSFNQFKDDYHFYDDENRLYRIASQNDDEFQNELLRGDGGGGGGGLRSTINPQVVEDEFGHILLYVKLKKRTSVWFDENALDRPVTLYVKQGLGGTSDEYRVRIQSTIKPDYKRRTGSITVSGINKQLCRLLLISSSQQS